MLPAASWARSWLEVEIRRGYEVGRIGDRTDRALNWRWLSTRAVDMREAALLSERAQGAAAILALSAREITYLVVLASTHSSVRHGVQKYRASVTIVVLLLVCGKMSR